MSEEIKLTLEETPVPTMELSELTKGADQLPTSTVGTEMKEAPVFDENSLTDDEKKMVDDFSKQIDLSNTNIVMQYGAASQKKMADFSQTALNNVRTKDMGEVGDMLTNLVGELRGFEEEDQKGIVGFFKRGAKKVDALKAKYDKTEVNVNKITGALEDHQITLMKDVALLDNLYDLNKTYFKELSMYILAGKKKLTEVRETELPAAKAKAEASNLPEDAQAANDLATTCDRFEKKIHDLELTRMISIQTAPQIRLVQSNDTLMSEKIQSTIVNTIPLWKSQMVLALGVAHSQQAAKAQREVTNMTNELLRKNADTLKMATVETAKESERGVVDMETLKHTNESLITTLDEVIKIQEEGKAKRREAEAELGRMETELKTKLLISRG